MSVYRSRNVHRAETRGWALLTIGAVIAVPSAGFVLAAIVLFGATPW